MDYNEVFIGFDLNRDFSIMTFYHKNNTEPMTVSTVAGEEKYQIPTPRDLFSLIEQGAERGVSVLSDFFKMCFEKLSAVGPMKEMTVTVTMEKMTLTWVKAIREALVLRGVSKNRIFLQDHLESFYYYALSQNKDRWRHKVALFEYEGDFINSYELSIDYSTKPAFVYVKNTGRVCLDEKTRGNRQPVHWNRMKDLRFMEHAKKMMEGDVFSTSYLIGEGFDQSWEKESLIYLCKKRHVYQGNNLYSRGACYGAMNLGGLESVGSFVYKGQDMIEQNVGMRMIDRGVEEYHNMISAGINYYMAWYECEYILDHTEEVVLYSQSITGEKLSHKVRLNGLPERPNRTTRVHMELSFSAPNKCRVRIDDLGFGEFYKSSGKKWVANIEF